MAGPDRARFRRSLDRLNEIMAGIVRKAEEVSLRRCPYKNAEDRCTAHFGCRYQRPPTAPGGLKVCTSDDKLDYRKAWEVDPAPLIPPDKA
ncbi:hypothetical protein HYY27_04300 [bacterium]|nr:hypothetical protein [bacterium]